MRSVLSDEKKLSIAALSLEVFTQHLTPDVARAIHFEFSAMTHSISPFKETPPGL
jgi:hypothetical protein